MHAQAAVWVRGVRAGIGIWAGVDGVTVGPRPAGTVGVRSAVWVRGVRGDIGIWARVGVEPVVVVVVAVVVVDGWFGRRRVVVDAVAVGLVEEPGQDLGVGVAAVGAGGGAEEDPGA